MIKHLYKRIIRKFGLSEMQLKELHATLVQGNICKGPFMQGEKSCPNTTALAIKEKRTVLKDSSQVRALMRKYNVLGSELWVFYIVFDLPAQLSDSYFKKALKDMRNAVNELIEEARPT